MQRSSSIFAVLLLLLAVCTGCQFMAGDEAAYRENLARLQVEIEAAAGEARATSESSCAVVSYGAKACGGPSRVVVFSEEDGDPDRLRRLTDAYTRLEAEGNRRFGWISDCMVLSPPVPVLVGGRCVPGPAPHHP